MKKEEGERKWKEEERKEGIEEVLPGMVGHTFSPSYSENKQEARNSGQHRSIVQKVGDWES